MKDMNLLKDEGAGQYIIGSIYKTSDGVEQFSFSPTPMIHSTYEFAETEAIRLARVNKDKNRKFVITKLVSTVQFTDIAITKL